MSGREGKAVPDPPGATPSPAAPGQAYAADMEMTQFRHEAEEIVTSADARLRPEGPAPGRAAPSAPCRTRSLSPACARGAGQAGHLRHVRGPRAVHAALRPARLRHGAAQRLAPTSSCEPPDRPRRRALRFLTIMYAHVPSVTTYPVYLGDLDALLEPFVPADLLRRRSGRASCDASGSSSTGCCPTRSCTPTSARRRPRAALDPARGALAAAGGAEHHAQGGPATTTDDLHRGRRPHRVRDRQAALRQPPDDGGRPRRASTRRSAATTR